MPENEYDAIVIGTGFGGAVAACRLSQAGLKVLVVERGRRYDKRDPVTNRLPFPRNFDDLTKGWLYEEDQGLFDVKPIEEVCIVECAGYGGGSLIYANVHLRPVADVFEKGWPAGYSRQTLDPYYDLVAYMLDIGPINRPERRRPLPVKTDRMADVMVRLDRSKQFYYPNIAVDLSDPDGGLHPNKFQVPQHGCTDCGECDIGCTYGAKNTLDLNYLAIAERSPAVTIAARCEAKIVRRTAVGYEVDYRDHASHTNVIARAPAVFVCGGAINSTELLLRSRDAGALPNLGEALGNGYSGNGDFLAFGFDTAADFHPDRGPTITTGVVYDRGRGDSRVWFTLQEGGYPKQIGSLFQLLRQDGSWWPAAGNLVRKEVDLVMRRSAHAVDAEETAETATSAVFLSMGRDLANGNIGLHPITKTLRIKWDLPGNLPLYDTEDRLVRDVVEVLGGKPANNPLWTLLNQPVSVHNLGGCCMADDPNAGVTNADGQVHGYPGLYVLDGACLPASTGVNPSHTIAAVAERNIERFIRARDPAWQAPERAHATPVVDPLAHVQIPDGGTAPTVHSPVGLSFTETMKGALSEATELPPNEDTYGAAEQAGKPAQFTLTITTADLDAFLADKMHTARAVGVLEVDGITPANGAEITAGVFNLFVVDGPHRRKMYYALPFVGADGERYLLDGFKDIVDRSFDVWPATTTLYTVIRKGDTHDGPVCRAGILHIEIPDFLHQLTTFRFPGATTPVASLEAAARFGKMFFGALWKVFVGNHLPDAD